MIVSIVRWPETLQAEAPCPRPGCGGVLVGINLYANGILGEPSREPFFSGWQCTSCPRGHQAAGPGAVPS